MPFTKEEKAAFQADMEQFAAAQPPLKLTVGPLRGREEIRICQSTMNEAIKFWLTERVLREEASNFEIVNIIAVQDEKGPGFRITINAKATLS